MIGRPFARICVLTLGCSISLILPAQTGNNDAVEHYAEAGQQALAAGNYSEAQTDFEQLSKLQPGIAEVHATLGLIYYKQRQYDSAVREIHTAQKLKPSLPRLDSLLGMSLAELGRFREALPGLEKGFKQSTDSEIRRMSGLQLLRAYTGLQRDADAVEVSLSLNKLYPTDPEVLYNTGRVLGNYTYIVMEKLHDEAPNSIWMLQAQGEAYESQKDYNSAIAAFNRVLTMDPQRPGIHYRMGRVYLRRFQDSHDDKDRTSAEEQFQAELAVDPKNGNSAYELAQIHYDLGDLDQARREFEALVTQRPDFEQARVGLAGVLLESQKADLALPQLKRAIELNPEDDVAWYRLARASRITGDTTAQNKAMAEFRRLHAAENKREGKTTPLTESGEVTQQQVKPTEEP